MRALPVYEPTYSFEHVSTPFWSDLDRNFGVWHPPNATFRHRTACTDATYTSNSYGARDPERARTSAATRVVVLGDSFVEGWGMESGNRLTDLLERKSGIEHLNFGTSGTFGTIQEWLQYQHLASGFSHDAVMLGMLPDNDFEDNDYDAGRKFHEDRYRPYLLGDYPGYRLIYYRKQAVDWPRLFAMERMARGILREWTYTYNLLAYLHARAALSDAVVPARPAATEGTIPTAALPPSRYYEFSDSEWMRVRYTIERIHALAGARPMLVFTIPRINDIRRYDTSGPSPLGAKMTQLADSLGIHYVDLLPPMHDASRDWDRYFIPCDGHWSVAGNQAAASILLEDSLYTSLRARGGTAHRAR